MLDLRRLKYFVVTAEALHFGRAAAILHIAQPPLSRQITALERDLGIRLFDRSSRAVTLTVEGSLFLHQARKVLKQAEYAERVAQQARLGELGNIHIGYASSIPLSDEFSGLVQQYAQGRPKVTLAFSEMSSGRQCDALLDGSLDIGFIRPSRTLLPKAIQALRLRMEPFFAVVNDNHSLAASDLIEIRQLAAEPFILFPPGFGSGLYDQLLEICADANFIPAVGAVAQQMTTIIALVAAGQGVSIVPASVRAIMRSGVRYIPLGGVTQQAEVALIYRHTEQSSAIRSFIELAGNAAAQFVATQRTLCVPSRTERRDPQ